MRRSSEHHCPPYAEREGLVASDRRDSEFSSLNDRASSAFWRAHTEGIRRNIFTALFRPLRFA